MVTAVVATSGLAVSEAAGGASGYSQNNITMRSGFSVNKIKAALPNNMKALAPTLYRIENSNKPVNSMFMAALISVETGNGTSNAYRTKNNVGGLMGRGGLMRFSSKEQSCYYLQSLLHRRYIPRGKDIWSVAKVYCAVPWVWKARVNSVACKYINTAYYARVR